MLNKIRNLFKDEKKKNENLIFFLLVLVITLFMINRIMNEDKTTQNDVKQKSNDLELVKNTEIDSRLEKRLEDILSKISGVGSVNVLITYSESGSILPLYNETSNNSKTEETVEDGNTKTTETIESKKEIIVDSTSNPIVEKTINPKIEGAIITAQGANNSKVKENIILAVEAATGLASHKIQVFSMDK